MITDLYQHYLYVIGKLKDVHKLNIDVQHKDIHTFYAGKTQVFKLLFGTYNESEGKSIVVSFHAELPIVAAIQWFMEIRKIHPPVVLSNIHYEDYLGEIFYGEDAEKILSLKRDQECLTHYLDELDKEEIREFTKVKVVGNARELQSTFSELERDKAISQFNDMKKPINDDEVQ